MRSKDDIARYSIGSLLSGGGSGPGGRAGGTATQWADMYDEYQSYALTEPPREEVLGTGMDWTFAPCVCVPRDDRWGRIYEGFGEVPAIAGPLGAASVQGFQGAALSRYAIRRSNR